MAEELIPQNKQELEKKEPKEIVLTEGNWKFLKGIRMGLKVYEAYRAAGYDGEPNAAYVMYSVLKKKFQAIVEADGFDKLRLSTDFEKVLSLPLEQGKTEVTLNEWMKARRLAHTIMSDNESKSPQASFTMIVIESGQTHKISEQMSKMVDVQEVTDNDGEASGQQLK